MLRIFFTITDIALNHSSALIAHEKTSVVLELCSKFVKSIVFLNDE